MRRKIYLLLCCGIVICCLIGLRYEQAHTKIDPVIPTDAEAYLYIDSASPDERQLVKMGDYPYLEKILMEIKYFNSTIAPADPHEMVWSGSSYVIELRANGETDYISLGTQELKSGVYAFYFSESSQFLKGYLSEDAAQAIETLIQKYMPTEAAQTDTEDTSGSPKPMPEMDIELENGIHVTGTVLVHEGKGYSLTEEEHHLLMNGADPAVVLAER